MDCARSLTSGDTRRPSQALCTVCLHLCICHPCWPWSQPPFWTGCRLVTPVNLLWPEQRAGEKGGTSGLATWDGVRPHPVCCQMDPLSCLCPASLAAGWGLSVAGSHTGGWPRVGCHIQAPGMIPQMWGRCLFGPWPPDPSATESTPLLGQGSLQSELRLLWEGDGAGRGDFCDDSLRPGQEPGGSGESETLAPAGDPGPSLPGGGQLHSSTGHTDRDKASKQPLLPAPQEAWALLPRAPGRLLSVHMPSWVRSAPVSTHSCDGFSSGLL